jgi:hypothetical protein
MEFTINGGIFRALCELPNNRHQVSNSPTCHTYIEYKIQSTEPLI